MKIFLDGPTLDDLRFYEDDGRVDGYTTNPTLMRKNGVRNYLEFADEALRATQKPISFEVFADEPDEMERQAWRLASLAPNVYVKIPVTNTRGYFLGDLIWRLSQEGIKVNVTAVFTEEQILDLFDGSVTSSAMPAIVSIFAGRIADTGIYPTDIINFGLDKSRGSEILWASPRSMMDYYLALDNGCDIITLPPTFLEKLALAGHDLTQYSLETIKMFYADAQAAGYCL